VLLEGADRGFDLHMLNDFTSLLADTTAARVGFDLTLTPAWPATEGLPLAAEIPQAALDVIERAVMQMRPADVPEEETIIGRIFRLESHENPADLLREGPREVGVEGISVERGGISVRVRLTPEDYLDALAAHSAGKAIQVRGIVRRTSRGSLMARTSDFRVVG
jgi:hypothetical protein